MVWGPPAYHFFIHISQPVRAKEFFSSTRKFSKTTRYVERLLSEEQSTSLRAAPPPKRALGLPTVNVVL